MLADLTLTGKRLIAVLSEELKRDFGKSYSERNLHYFRKFYLLFPDEQIVNACVHNLDWTHFRSLLHVTDENARLWYLNEAIREGWSSRTLDRNIGTQYYCRLLQSPQMDAVSHFPGLSFCLFALFSFLPRSSSGLPAFEDTSGVCV